MDRFISGGPDGAEPASLPHDVDRLVHKLRTPLNSLSLNADLLGSVSQPKSGKEALYARALKSLQTEVGRLDGIASDFQRYVAASDPAMRKIAAPDLVKGAVAAASNGNLLRVEVTPVPELHFQADALLLSAALLELIRNAIESNETGVVRVESTIAGGQLCIEVIDAGGGIEFDPPDRAFELFMGSKQGHAGFGLTFARRVARIHGGEVDIVRTGREGTTIRLAIPV